MLKKLTKVTAVAAVAVSSCLSIIPVSAKTAKANEVSVNKTNNSLTIGNAAISREFGLEKGKLSTKIIDNKLGNVKFNPKKGSEEFIINLLQENSKIEFNKPSQGELISVKPSSKNEVTVKVSSTTNDNGVNSNNLIDGNEDTYWASAEDENQAVGSQWVELDFSNKQNIKSIMYTPRWDNKEHYNCTGRVTEYKLEVFDGENLVHEETKSFTETPKETTKGNGKKTITLDKMVEGTKIRLTANDSYFWQPEKHGKYMNVAELDVLDEKGSSLVHAKNTNWTIDGTSNSTVPGDNGGYEALIDGNPNTYYHSNYGQGTGEANKLPVDITLDLGKETSFDTFGYLPRNNNGKIANGDILEYEIYVGNSKDSKELYKEENKKISSKIIYKENGVFEGTKTNYIYKEFPETQNAQFVGLRILNGEGGFASGAEIDLYKGKFSSFKNEQLYPATEVKTSDLTLKGEPVVEDTKAVINKVNKTGKMVTFNFEPFKGINVAQKVVMYDGDHFMRKFLEVKFDDKTQRIDYIDGEHLVLNDTDNHWTIPHVGGVVQMEEFKANLGQPIYIDGMFLGSEFPATQNEVVKNTGFVRYFTGKNFNDFERDGQLTTDGKYVSWQTVVGASPVSNTEGNNLDIVKQSFFQYIDSIATPSDFRIQYNSWFDNMMRITDENILSSFSAVDKHLSETGVRPLDSYVVDDGWNIYRGNKNDLQAPIDIERNGKDDVNEDGFWTFNSKFPNGLKPSSDLVQNFGSNFGVWVGPRGGYNYYGQLADIIAKAGKGSKAGGSIDVADDRYVKEFEKMAIDWVKKYHVNYWKWDGFADSAQYNAFPKGEGVVGYDENHHHMYGGIHGMYHVTDLWEKWISLMKNTRSAAEAQNINNLWISLTCYVNPSPWYLQWANSVWIQCVADRGERTNNNPDLNNKMDNMLSYRDGCYYDFVVKHKFQFPLANLYNHDPIYGSEETGINKNSMDGEMFKNYLFMQGTRGTAFWELYYSDSILDEEKYLVNADFLEWAETNFDLLKNAIMIGGTPSSTATLDGNPTGPAGDQKAYGFAGFNTDGTEGTISMRNPASTEQTISFTLDKAIGVKTATGTTYSVTKDHEYVAKNTTSKAELPTTAKQGETINVTLQPGETYVLHFNTKADKDAPVLNKLYIKDNKTLQVKTSEHINNADFKVLVDGKEVKFEISKSYADDRTFELSLDKELSKGAKVEVASKAGKDDANNALSGKVELKYYKNGVVASAKSVKENKVISKSDNSIVGNNGFAVSANVATKQNNTVLVSQGNDYKLGIDQAGHPYFELNGKRAVSNQVITSGENYLLTGVKENNGIIKLYVDGKVDSSCYFEANKDFSVSANDIKVNAKDSKVSDVKVYNESLGYDEVPTLPLKALVEKVENEKDRYTSDSWKNANMDELLSKAKDVIAKNDKTEMNKAYEDLYAGYKKLIPDSVNLALNKEITAAWTDKNQTDPVTNAGSPLAKANDGKLSDAGQHAIVGKDGNATPCYIEIDLGKEYDIDRVQLYRYWDDNRTYDSTALVVSKDKDFDEKTVLYYSGDTDKFNLGVEPKEKLYAETKDGKELYNGSAVKARYVRLYVSGKKADTPSENHIVELQVFGQLDDAYNISELEKLVEDAEELANSKLYTSDTVKNLNAAIEKAKEVIKNVKSGTQEDKTIGYVLNAKDALIKAMDELVENPDLTPIEPSTPVDPDKPVDPDGNKPVTPVKPVVPTKPSTDDKSDKVENEEKPNTGATSNVALLWTITLGAGAVAVALAKKKKKA